MKKRPMSSCSSIASQLTKQKSFCLSNKNRRRRKRSFSTARSATRRKRNVGSSVQKVKENRENFHHLTRYGKGASIQAGDITLQGEEYAELNQMDDDFFNNSEFQEKLQKIIKRQITDKMRKGRTTKRRKKIRMNPWSNRKRVRGSKIIRSSTTNSKKFLIEGRSKTPLKGIRVGRRPISAAQSMRLNRKRKDQRGERESLSACEKNLSGSYNPTGLVTRSDCMSFRYGNETKYMDVQPFNDTGKKSGREDKHRYGIFASFKNKNRIYDNSKNQLLEVAKKRRRNSIFRCQNQKSGKNEINNMRQKSKNTPRNFKNIISSISIYEKKSGRETGNFLQNKKSGREDAFISGRRNTVNSASEGLDMILTKERLRDRIRPKKVREEIIEIELHQKENNPNMFTLETNGTNHRHSWLIIGKKARKF